MIKAMSFVSPADAAAAQQMALAGYPPEMQQQMLMAQLAAAQGFALPYCGMPLAGLPSPLHQAQGLGYSAAMGMPYAVNQQMAYAGVQLAQLQQQQQPPPVVQQVKLEPTTSVAVPQPQVSLPQPVDEVDFKPTIAQFQDVKPTMAQFQAGPSTSAASALAAGGLKRRRFSGAKIQPTRVKKVMQSDEEIGRMVASVPVAIGRAMEHFAEKFLLASAAAMTNTGSRTLNPQHMKIAVLQNPQFAFLQTLFNEIGLPSRSGEAYMPMVQASFPTTSTSTAANEAAPMPTLAGIVDSSVQQQQQQQSFGEQPVYSPLDALANPHPSTAIGQLFGGGNLPYQPPVPTFPTPQSTPSPLAQSPVAPAPAPRTIRRSSSNSSANGDVAGGVATPEKRPRGRPRKVKKDIKCVEDDLVVESSSSNITTILAAPTPAEVKQDSNDVDRVLMPPPALPIRLAPKNE